MNPGVINMIMSIGTIILGFLILGLIVSSIWLCVECLKFIGSAFNLTLRGIATKEGMESFRVSLRNILLNREKVKRWKYC